MKPADDVRAIAVVLDRLGVDLQMDVAPLTLRWLSEMGWRLVRSGEPCSPFCPMVKDCPECDYQGGAVRFVTLADPTTRLDVPTNRARPAGNRALTTTTDAKRSHRGCI